MKIWQRRRLSFLFAMLLCFISVAHFAMPVRADGEHDPVEVSGITYDWDGNVYVGFVGSEYSGTAISIPADYHLIMGTGSNSLAGVTVSMASGAWLEIYDGVAFQGTVTPSGDACLKFADAGSVPDSITLYEADCQTLFLDNTDNIADIGNHTFIYLEDEGKWVDLVSSPWINVNLGGFDPEADDLTVEYKYTGGNYTALTLEEDQFENRLFLFEDPEFPGNYSGGFEPANIPDNWDNKISIRFTLDSRRDPTPARIILAELQIRHPEGYEGTGGAMGLRPGDSINDTETGITAALNNDGTVFTADIITVDDLEWIGISPGFPDSGDPAITEKADDYLYAYYADDADGVKALFAEELICRLMDPSLFDYFGMPEITGSEAEQRATRAANVTTLLSRIEASGSSYQVTAMDPNGTPHNINVQDYTVNWGVSSETGSPVESTLPVYTMENINQVLICRDFNDETGRGTDFLICNINTDATEISEGGEHAAVGVRFCVDSINPSTIKSGGMGRMETVINDEGIYTIETNGGAPASFLRVTDPVQGAEMIRLLKASENYLAIGGEGEPNAYGLIGDNGRHVDKVWATSIDDTAVARVYVGDNTIHLYPLNNASGVTYTDILSVELEDPAQEDGVILDASDPSDVTLTFRSNFYDEIPLKIIFEGNRVRHLTVVRVGLVIQYEYLRGDSNSGEDDPHTGEVRLDYLDGGGSLTYTYNYFGDGHGNGAEQVAIWATYYHPTNDPTGGSADVVLYLTFDNGDHRVVYADDQSHNFNGRVAMDNGCVASTSFLIGFDQTADHFDGNVWIGSRENFDYREGGFYATVLNEGFDDATTYGGTQIGSGKGVYWDGHISFYR